MFPSHHGPNLRLSRTDHCPTPLQKRGSHEHQEFSESISYRQHTARICHGTGSSGSIRPDGACRPYGQSPASTRGNDRSSGYWRRFYRLWCTGGRLERTGRRERGGQGSPAPTEGRANQTTVMLQHRAGCMGTFVEAYRSQLALQNDLSGNRPIRFPGFRLSVQGLANKVGP